MSQQIAEVMKQFVMSVPGVEPCVKARITKFVDAEGRTQFRWEISHFYAPSEDAGVYFPSKPTGPDLDNVETMLKAYMNNFTAISVTPNKDY